MALLVASWSIDALACDEEPMACEPCDLPDSSGA
jgi:hypothetical protein